MAAFSTTRQPTPLYRWASLRSELLWVWEGPISEAARSMTADHGQGYWAWLLRKGRVQVEMDGKTWKAKAGQWMISPQGMMSQKFSSDARLLSVHFRCQWPTGENLFAGRDGLVMNASEFPRLERSAVALRRLVHRHLPGVRINFSAQATDYPVFLRFQQMFQQWLIDFADALIRKNKFLTQVGEGDERVLRAARCLNEVPLDVSFPAASLQRETGLGRAHLDRLYWKEFGVTTRVYWDRLREDSATRHLETTSLSIKEVGYRLGFKQASHFTKWFRQRRGVSPKAFREQAIRNLAVV
jgi:AraC-like DNA-binding protein